MRNAPCPHCGHPASLRPDNPSRPFCSERCQMSDLGAWFEERYTLPADPAEPDDDPRDQ